MICNVFESNSSGNKKSLRVAVRDVRAAKRGRCTRLFVFVKGLIMTVVIAAVIVDIVVVVVGKVIVFKRRLQAPRKAVVFFALCYP